VLNVILCDDDPTVVDLVKNFIEGYSMMEGLQDVNIELATGDPLEVLELFRTNIELTDGTIEQIAKPLKHRLLYLDIDLGDLGRERKLDGVSLAREIRKFDIGADISFLTHNRMTISDVLNYKIAPIAFLNKPFIDEDKEALQKEVTDLLKFAHDRMSKNLVDKKMIEFKTGHRKVYVNLADVYYIQGNDDKDKDKDVNDASKSALTILCEAGGNQYLKRSLSFYDKNIPELVKLGKFYLVNPLNVKEVITSGRYATVMMVNGNEIRVTRKAFNDYEALINEMRTDGRR
jgi:two-component system response regulator AgrA